MLRNKLHFRQNCFEQQWTAVSRENASDTCGPVVRVSQWDGVRACTASDSNKNRSSLRPVVHRWFPITPLRALQSNKEIQSTFMHGRTLDTKLDENEVTAAARSCQAMPQMFAWWQSPNMCTLMHFRHCRVISSNQISVKIMNNSVIDVGKNEFAFYYSRCDGCAAIALPFFSHVFGRVSCETGIVWIDLNFDEWNGSASGWF